MGLNSQAYWGFAESPLSHAVPVPVDPPAMSVPWDGHGFAVVVARCLASSLDWLRTLNGKNGFAKIRCEVFERG